jgi:methylase of polypeptide subunit release factors
LKTLLERSLILLSSGLDEFVEEPGRCDLIVSNPHFIPKTTKQKMNNADLARFQEAMPLRI